MAWISRGGRCYYYRSRRVGKRVVRDYVGCGEEARLAAALDGLRRARREAGRAERRQEREQWLAACSPLEALAAGTDLLARAALLAAGYRQHHHGTWRKRRDQNR